MWQATDWNGEVIVASQHEFKGKIVAVGLMAISLSFLNLALSQENSPAGFRDRTSESGLELSNSPACWIDVDNDGWTDLCTGGIVWRNDSGKRFVKLAEGFSEVVAADFDNDGDLDLVTAGRLFENLVADGHWLELLIEGDGQAVNRSAIGTQARIPLQGKILTRQIAAGMGQGNQDGLVPHFGLGEHAEAVRLDILCPNGIIQTVEKLEVDRRIALRFQKLPN